VSLEVVICAMRAPRGALHGHSLVLGTMEFAVGGVRAVFWCVLQGRGMVCVHISHRVGVGAHPDGICCAVVGGVGFCWGGRAVGGWGLGICELSRGGDEFMVPSSWGGGLCSPVGAA
jgi:hypothetical protein